MLEENYLDKLRSITQQNCVFVLQHEGRDSVLLEPRISLLKICLDTLIAGRLVVHGIVAVYSQRGVPALVSDLSSLSISVIEIVGHSDIVQLRLKVAQVWDRCSSQIIVVSDICLLHLLCLGLIRMEELDFLFFDNLTNANNHHPYCIIMEMFYAPIVAKNFKDGLILDGVRVPRIFAFANWPKMQIDETFQAKMERVSKLSHYNQTFFSVVIPLKLSETPWLVVPKSELEEVYKQPEFFSQSKMLICRSSSEVEEELINVIKQNRECVVVCQDPVQVKSLMTRTGLSAEIADDCPSRSIQRCTMIVAADDYATIKTIVGLSDQVIILFDLFLINPHLILALEQRIFAHEVICLTTATTSNASSFLWIMTNIAAKKSGSEAMTRQLHDFFSNIRSIDRTAYLISDSSDFHRRSSTGAMLIPSFCSSLLLTVCSYFPKGRNNKIKIKTFPVKRITEEGVILDSTQHYFLSKILLPRCLLDFGFFDMDQQLEITGPLAANRTLSLALASFEALKVLHGRGIIDDNYIPVCRIRESAGTNCEETITDVKDDDLGDLGEPQLIKINEIIPSALRFSEFWQTIAKEAMNPKSHDFYFYQLRYTTFLKDGTTNFDPKLFDLPVDTCIHLMDTDFFCSDRSGRSIGFLFAKKLDEMLLDTIMPCGSHYSIRGRLIERGRIAIRAEELEKLLEFQVFLFGATNPHAIGLASEIFDTAGSGDLVGDMNFVVPNDKKLAYLTAFVKMDGIGETSSVFDKKKLWEQYSRFVEMAKNVSLVDRGHRNQTMNLSGWGLDWDSMRKAVDQDNYMLMDDFSREIRSYISDNEANLPVAPLMTASPDKPPTKLDLLLFSLRRLVLYTPHNGLYHRVKRFRDDMNATSPFKSQQFPNCQSYADYMQLRYGLVTKEPLGPLIEVERIENFADINKWTDKDKKPKRGSGRKKSNFKSIIIPEFAKIVPIPYVFIRMAMLLPRMIFDVEQQLLTLQYFLDQLSPLRDHWPSTNHIVRALTSSTANVQYNYERMEIIGDSILKLFTTVDIFINNITMAEGRLSLKREGLVSNYNLCMLASNLKLPFYARLCPFMPKLFSPPNIASILAIKPLMAKWPYVEDLFDDGKTRWKLVQSLGSKSEEKSSLFYLTPSGKLIETDKRAQNPVQIKHQQKNDGLSVVTRFGTAVPPKSLADLMESTISAFYCGPNGLDGALQFLIYVGLVSSKMRNYRNFDPLEVVNKVKPSSWDESPRYKMARTLCVSDNQSCLDNVPSYAPDKSSFPYEQVEDIIGYKFKHRELLFMACTHATVNIACCYERLEWLGDAVMDWIVMRYYYEDFDDIDWMTPERITWARQAAVCSDALGITTVKLGLHEFLRISEPHLQREIRKFANFCHNEEGWPRRQFGGTSTVSRSIEESQIQSPPKVLGDLFESLAGAVFLDLQFDISSFSTVFMPLLKPYLETYANPYNLPDDPVRDFWHYLQVAGIDSKIFFDFPEPREGQETECLIRIGSKIVSEGKGSTRALAKLAAIQKTLCHIQSKEWRDLWFL